jgi:hypothetical protein
MSDVTSDVGSALANQNVTAPDPTAPNFGGPGATAPDFNQGAVPPAPDASNLPRPNPIGDPQIQANLQRSADNATFHQQTAEQEQATADVVRHAVFGKAVKSLVGSLNGTQTTYRANPETGQVEQVDVPQRPGGFFRNLISGMLIGAAAGGERPTDKDGRPIGGGFAGGFARGIGANINSRQQQDQQAYARAQEQVKNQQEQRRLTSEETMHAAMTAHENIQTASILHNMHVVDQENVDKHNAASRAYQQSLVDSGALPAKLSIGGKLMDTVDGTTLQQAFIKDPSIMQASQGYQRHFISTADLTELHYNGKEWTDDSGNPVNIGKNIQIRAYDLPNDTLDKPRQYSGKQINAARRQKIVEDDKNYTLTPHAFSAIYTLGTKEAADEARANHQRNLDEQRNKNVKQFTEIEAKKSAALAKAEHTYWSNLNGGKDPESALTELNAAKQAAQDSYENEIGAAGGTAGHFEYNKQAPQAGGSQGPQKTFSPTKWKASNPNGDVNAAINEAKQQGMTVIQ